MKDIVELTKEACGPCCTCSAPKCPRCKELLVHPRGLPSYCEECGWPDEDFDDLDKHQPSKTFWNRALTEKIMTRILFAVFAAWAVFVSWVFIKVLFSLMSGNVE